MGELRAAADRTYQAAGFANDAAQRLSASPVQAGIFGAFDAAESFHRALSGAHSNHELALRRQTVGLGGLGDAAHTVASAFTGMEDRNAAALRDLR